MIQELWSMDIVCLPTIPKKGSTRLIENSLELVRAYFPL